MKTPTIQPVPSSKVEKDEALDDALADSFPASDPISPGAPHRSTRADEEHIAEHVATQSDHSKDK